MPSSDTPIPDLSPQLFSLLLRSTGWLLLAALIVTALTWSIGRLGRPAWRRSTSATLEADQKADQVADQVPVDEPSARRFVRVSFGVLWIVDGLLQAQPDMPGGFISRVIGPQLASSPSWLVDITQPLASSSRSPHAMGWAIRWRWSPTRRPAGCS